MRLAKIGADGEEQWVDVAQIARPGDLGDIANLGLTMAEGKLVLAGLQQEFIAGTSPGARRRLPAGLPKLWRCLLRERLPRASGRDAFRLRHGAAGPILLCPVSCDRGGQ